ncbi:hypothetical protein OLMES_2568 [Oleiphilus messinensis]|uniref:Chalcone isomerase domain-containing protein n=1 Tax=Oleiphilus messinensis TaxID=141451 RepID=A0A1Y0I8V0_9GAMM|nr:chalcone isomerase family protein [Oleiphilus messinensis]ARU56619.1 hypothetical protein OLMES_2568 [Oleiphilus messinensis]
MQAAFSILLTLMLVPTLAQSRTIGDVELQEEVQVGSNGPVLSLNGASLRRTYMIVKTYVGGLYLEHPTHNEEQIITSDEYKRMMFHVLLNRVTARKVARALKEALVVNLSRDQHTTLEPDIDKFLDMFDGKLHRSDEVNIDYIPGTGTQVTIAGEVKGVIPGKAFSDALLSVWVGREPVSDSFKSDILGIN